jgi:hypothetical protein
MSQPFDLYFSNYGNFTRSNDDIKREEQNKNTINAKRQELIQQHVRNNGLVKLKSDYLGMDSFYYDKRTKTMYKLCNICDSSKNINPIFNISTDQHILKLNSLI